MSSFFKDTAKLVLTPLSVLYVFGFLCMTSYLSQFGLTSFDLLSTRFISAGIFPLISVSACLFAAYKFGFPLYNWNVWGFSKAKARYYSCYAFIWSSSFITITLQGIFSISSKYVSNPTPSLDIHNWVMDSTALGKFIVKITSLDSTEMTYLAQSSIQIFPFMIVAVILMVPLAQLFKKISKISNEGSAKTQNTPPAGPDSPILLRSKVVIVVADAIILSLSLSVATLTIYELKIGIASLDNIDNIHPANFWLILCWVMSFTVPLSMIMPVITNNSVPITERFRSLFNTPSVYTTVGLVLAPALASTYIFGSAIFPRIPFELGGGSPRPVQITLHDGAQNILHGKTFLLDENSKYFFVVMIDGNNRHAIALRKDVVDAIETKTSAKSRSDDDDGNSPRKSVGP